MFERPIACHLAEWPTLAEGLAGARGLGFGAEVAATEAVAPGDSLAAAFSQAGVTLAAVHAGGAVGRLNWAGVRELVEEHAAVAAAAKRVGCDRVVISTGAWLHRTRPDMRVVARVIDEVARAVADAGAVAALCAQWGTEVATASELFAVLDRSSAVQACPDTAHLMAAGDDPAATVRACEGRLAAIRLNDLGADGASRPLGEGRLDVTAVLDAVDGMEYDGWITVSAARSSHQAIGRWASVRAGGR